MLRLYVRPESEVAKVPGSTMCLRYALAAKPPKTVGIVPFYPRRPRPAHPVQEITSAVSLCHSEGGPSRPAKGGSSLGPTDTCTPWHRPPGQVCACSAAAEVQVGIPMMLRLNRSAGASVTARPRRDLR